MRSLARSIINAAWNTTPPPLLLSLPRAGSAASAAAISDVIIHLLMMMKVIFDLRGSLTLSLSPKQTRRFSPFSSVPYKGVAGFPGSVKNTRCDAADVLGQFHLSGINVGSFQSSPLRLPSFHHRLTLYFGQLISSSVEGPVDFMNNGR